MNCTKKNSSTYLSKTSGQIKQTTSVQRLTVYNNPNKKTGIKTWLVGLVIQLHRHNCLTNILASSYDTDEILNSRDYKTWTNIYWNTIYYSSTITKLHHSCNNELLVICNRQHILPLKAFYTSFHTGMHQMSFYNSTHYTHFSHHTNYGNN